MDLEGVNEINFNLCFMEKELIFLGIWLLVGFFFFNGCIKIGFSIL